MANATPIRLGFQNNTSDASFAQDNALFLKVFGGEILTAFKETNIMEALHMTRTILSGKSAQFPASWRATAAYHTPGAEITGGQILLNEVVINIDNLLLASDFIANIDEAKNHYDVRGEFAFQLGAALARQYDKNLQQLVILGARASATVTGGSGGSASTLATYGTVGADLASGIFLAAQKLDEKDVPADDRYATMKPAQYYLLGQTTLVLNSDWGGRGSYADGKVLDVAGVGVKKSNNFPTTNVAAITGDQNTYAVNATNTVAGIFHKSAVGTVKLMDMQVESDYDMRRQGTLMVAKYAMGHGILRPEACVELKTA